MVRGDGEVLFWVDNRVGLYCQEKLRCEGLFRPYPKPTLVVG